MFRGNWYRQPPFIIPLLLLVGIAALSVTHGGQNYHAANHYEQSSRHAGENPAGAIQPPSGDIATGEADEHNPQAEIQPSERHLFLSDTWAQWLMALGTIATVVLVTWTVLVTRKMLKEAEDTATAARDAVDVTRVIGEKQVRAYVAFDLSSFPDTISIKEKPNIRIGISNSGQSPAIQLCIQSGLNPCPLTLLIPNDPDVVFRADGKDKAAKSTIPAGGTYFTGASCSQTPSELLGGNPKINKYVFIGQVTYLDVFDIEHKTTACFIGEIIRTEGDEAYLEWSTHQSLNHLD